VRVRFEDVARVHSEEYLESLARHGTLARIFGVDPWDVPVDEVMRTVRLGCGGTLAAATDALQRHGPTVNLMGGFHHAAPGHGAGLCALNDMAIAVKRLRHDGFDGQVVLLDLDAHPPDGTAACLRDEPGVWIGSLSGPAAGVVAGVDETILPEACDDEAYLAALEQLLLRMPAPELAFVIAGGDVLAGDHLGRLGLTLDGARRRDLRVARALLGRGSVWLPGGGYHARAWQVLAGTVLALMRHTRREINPGADPMTTRFARLARHLRPGTGGRGLLDIDFSDVESELGLRARGARELLLGTYTTDAIEYALFRFGILGFLERRGYGQLRVAFGTATSGGERASIYGQAGGTEHILVDCVLERRVLEGVGEVLYVHWLTLRDPRARFSDRRPPLPGQDVPGLGIAREAVELFVLALRRLNLAALAFAPAYYHTAAVSAERFEFLDPVLQGRFEALRRDLGDRGLAALSQAVTAGRVRMDGEPYTWVAAEMVLLRDGRLANREAVEEERDRVRFTLEGGPAPVA
jgi:acetoin utilization deacetylase AcuC-like enzyme